MWSTDGYTGGYDEENEKNGPKRTRIASFGPFVSFFYYYSCFFYYETIYTGTMDIIKLQRGSGKAATKRTGHW